MNHLLDELDPKLLRDLTSDIAPFQRSTIAANRYEQEVAGLLEKHGQWLSLQDIPAPILVSDSTTLRQASPKQSPRSRPSSVRTVVPTQSPSILKHPSHRSQSDLRGEDVFLMDEDMLGRHASSSIPEPQLGPSTGKAFTWGQGKSKELLVRYVISLNCGLTCHVKDHFQA